MSTKKTPTTRGKAKATAESKSKTKKTAKEAGGTKAGSQRPTLAGPTTFLTRASVPAEWHVVDLAGKPLGRIASEIVCLLRGKQRPSFHPSQDTGDFVVALNASKVVLTGNKPRKKIYYRHSGYLGHLKRETAEHLQQRKPDYMVWLAVKGMMPTSTLGRNQLKRLFIYAGTEHPHKAQQPKTVSA